MNTNPDSYYGRSEVSNSDLTELKNLLHPHQQYGDREAAFRFGSLVDAVITEPERVNYYRLTVDDVPYTADEFLHAKEMYRALRTEARRDPFLAKVLDTADTQRVMVNRAQPFTYGGFSFVLDTRCKWDWFLSPFGFGGDLKTTFASTQKEFDEAVDFFDWDRSRAWYMDIAHSDRDFIYAISKKNNRIFKKFISRGDDVYNRGRDKYEELAFQYWCLAPVPSRRSRSSVPSPPVSPSPVPRPSRIPKSCALPPSAGTTLPQKTNTQQCKTHSIIT